MPAADGRCTAAARRIYDTAGNADPSCTPAVGAADGCRAFTARCGHCAAVDINGAAGRVHIAADTGIILVNTVDQQDAAVASLTPDMEIGSGRNINAFGRPQRRAVAEDQVDRCVFRNADPVPQCNIVAGDVPFLTPPGGYVFGNRDVFLAVFLFEMAFIVLFGTHIAHFVQGRHVDDRVVHRDPVARLLLLRLVRCFPGNKTVRSEIESALWQGVYASANRADVRHHPGRSAARRTMEPDR